VHVNTVHTYTRALFIRTSEILFIRTREHCTVRCQQSVGTLDQRCCPHDTCICMPSRLKLARSHVSLLHVPIVNRQPTVDLANVNSLHGVVVSNLGMLDFSTKSLTCLACMINLGKDACTCSSCR
jgi:hypothetical protein